MLKRTFEGWTEENVSILIEMLTKGHSAAHVRDRIGCSRNAAIGKALRLGYSFKHGGIVRKIEAREEERKATRASAAWTEQEFATASKLWAQGKTAGQIGFAIGKTVSAVSGMVQDHRDLFPFRNRTNKAASAAAQHVKMLDRVVRQRDEREAPIPAPDPDFDASAFDIEPSYGQPISRRLQLTELTEDTCKWPQGDPAKVDFHFCGVQSDRGSPYCTYHHRLAYRPRETVSIGGRRA